MTIYPSKDTLSMVVFRAVHHVAQSDRTRLDWNRLDWTRLEQTGLDQTGPDWTRLEQTGLDWTGLVPVQHSWNPHYDQQFSISKRGTKCQNIMIFIIFGEEFQYVCWSKGYSQSSANHALGQWVNLTSSLVHFLS